MFFPFSPHAPYFINGTMHRPLQRPPSPHPPRQPHSLGRKDLEEIRRVTTELALALGVIGLMNVQYALHGDQLYVIEANPRASRTVPFVSKATGVPLARIATKVMLGKTLDELGVFDRPLTRHVAAKECVFPFKKLPGVDTVLGPEMRSTGEVMGVGETVARAYGKALRGIGVHIDLPSADRPGVVLFVVSPNDRADKLNLCAETRSGRHREGPRPARGSRSSSARDKVPVVYGDGDRVRRARGYDRCGDVRLAHRCFRSEMEARGARCRGLGERKVESRRVVGVAGGREPSVGLVAIDRGVGSKC